MTDAAGERKVPSLAIAMMAAAGAVTLGAVLPWASMMGLGIGGLDTGDGKVVMLTGLVGLSVGIAAAVKKAINRIHGLGVLVPGLIAAAISVYDYLNMKNSLSGPGGSEPGDALGRELASAMVSIGFGLYFCILGGAAMVVVGYMSLGRRN